MQIEFVSEIYEAWRILGNQETRKDYDKFFKSKIVSNFILEKMNFIRRIK